LQPDEKWNAATRAKIGLQNFAVRLEQCHEGNGRPVQLFCNWSTAGQEDNAKRQ